jgi:signal transduction histidine kinase
MGCFARGAVRSSFISMILWLAMFLSGLQASAAEVVRLGSAAVHLDPVGARIERSVGIAPQEPTRWQALPDSAFREIRGKSLWFGWKVGRVLLRIPVDADQPGIWWMQVEYPGLDSVRLENHGAVSGWIGDDLPKSRWQSPWHGFYLPVKLEKGRNLLHVEVFGTHGRLGLVLNLRPESQQMRLIENQALRDGLFVGLLLANFLFSVWLFWVVRRPPHLWYLLYQASVTVFIFTYHHHGFAWLWPEHPIFNHFDRTSTSLATFGIVSMFLHQLLGFREAFPHASRVLRWMIWALLAGAVAQFLYPWEHRVFEWLYYANRVEPLEVGTHVFALVLTSMLAVKGNRLASLVLLAMSPMILALGISMSAEIFHLPWLYEFRGIVLEFALTAENLSLSFLLVQQVVKERRDHHRLVEKHLALELDFSRRLAQETDRNLRGTALDLHDGVGQELAGMALYLRSVLRQVGTPELTDSVSSEMGRVMEAVRQTAHRIYPPELMEGGLRHALERLAQRLRSTGEVQISVEGNMPDPGEDAALHWYRIAQEAISNAQRHGKARRIAVRLSPGKLVVEDDGIGAPPEITEGLGLRGIRMRAELLGAQVRLESGKQWCGAMLSVTASGS